VTLKTDQNGQNTASHNVPEPLSTVVKVNGSTYHQIEREGRVAIYEGPKPGMFEVIVIRVEKPRIIGEKFYPLREVCPSPENWGLYGFTFTSRSHHDPLKAAREKMQSLAQEKPSPKTRTRSGISAGNQKENEHNTDE
jgi:hypothetical protein